MDNDFLVVIKILDGHKKLLLFNMLVIFLYWLDGDWFRVW